MDGNVIVWDIKTVPDLKGFAAANGYEGKSEDHIRAVMGLKSQKPLYHSIVCIGSLLAQWEDDHWVVNWLEAHAGRSEKMLIASFVDRIATLAPQLVTFGGASFALPVLFYRATVNGVAAPGLSLRPYFNRDTEDSVDLCDALSLSRPEAKVTLCELSRVMKLSAGRDISGGTVEKYYREDRFRTIARCCERNVADVYQVWLRYEHFRGRLSDAAFQASQEHLFHGRFTIETMTEQLADRMLELMEALPKVDQQDQMEEIALLLSEADLDRGLHLKHNDPQTFARSLFLSQSPTAALLAQEALNQELGVEDVDNPVELVRILTP